MLLKFGAEGREKIPRTLIIKNFNNRKYWWLQNPVDLKLNWNSHWNTQVVFRDRVEFIGIVCQSKPVQKAFGSIRPAVSKWAKTNSTFDTMLAIKGNSVMNFLNLNSDPMVNSSSTELIHYQCITRTIFRLGKLRYANNSNYKNDTMIRKEVRLFKI